MSQRERSPLLNPGPERSRRRWTPQRQLAFLDVLARSRCVSAAAKAVGMSREGAYRLRGRRDCALVRGVVGHRARRSRPRKPRLEPVEGSHVRPQQWAAPAPSEHPFSAEERGFPRHRLTPGQSARDMIGRELCDPGRKQPFVRRTGASGGLVPGLRRRLQRVRKSGIGGHRNRQPGRGQLLALVEEVRALQPLLDRQRGIVGARSFAGGLDVAARRCVDAVGRGPIGRRLGGGRRRGDEGRGGNRRRPGSPPTAVRRTADRPLPEPRARAHIGRRRQIPLRGGACGGAGSSRGRSGRAVRGLRYRRSAAWRSTWRALAAPEAWPRPGPRAAEQPARRRPERARARRSRPVRQLARRRVRRPPPALAEARPWPGAPRLLCGGSWWIWWTFSW